MAVQLYREESLIKELYFQGKYFSFRIETVIGITQCGIWIKENILILKV
jgi:hypothetical protein